MSTTTQSVLTETAIAHFVEKAARPGLLGIVGQGLEKRCKRELSLYFRNLAEAIKALKLENLVESGNTEEIVRHSVEMKLANVLRKYRAVLSGVMETNLADAFNAALKMDYIAEASHTAPTPYAPPMPPPAPPADDTSDATGSQQGLDKLGPSGQAAADWAAQHTGELIKGIDSTTVDKIADAVMNGIEQRLGIPGTGRLIRNTLSDMSVYRSESIATTEMNNAMSTAALDKMRRIGVQYKQLILADDACEICQENADADPIPVDEAYPSGDLGPAFHTR